MEPIPTQPMTLPPVTTSPTTTSPTASLPSDVIDELWDLSLRPTLGIRYQKGKEYELMRCIKNISKKNKGKSKDILTPIVQEIFGNKTIISNNILEYVKEFLSSTPIRFQMKHNPNKEKQAIISAYTSFLPNDIYPYTIRTAIGASPSAVHASQKTTVCEYSKKRNREELVSILKCKNSALFNFLAAKKAR